MNVAPAATSARRLSASTAGASSSSHQQQQHRQQQSRRRSNAPSQQEQLEEKQARRNSQSQQSQQSPQQSQLFNGGQQQQQQHQHVSSSSSTSNVIGAVPTSSTTGTLTHRKNSHHHNSNNNHQESAASFRSVKNDTTSHNDNDNNHIYSTQNSTLRNVLDGYQMLRYKAGKIVNNKHFELFIVTLIALNALMMGIGTYPFIKHNPDALYVFEIIDLIFLIIFTAELSLQFLFHGWRLILNGWLVFDLIIIVTSWSFAEVQIIRAFRIFRALRLITRVKVMKNLVLALFGVMPRMFAIGLLLLLVSYIFAVMFTQLFKDLYKRNLTSVDYFGRMDHTFFTLFQIMTLDAWAEVAREVMAVYAWAWLPFIVFVIITGFVVVNLIIAVICDAIAALHDDEKDKLHGTYEEDHPEYYDEQGNYIGNDPDLLAAQEHERQKHQQQQQQQHYQTNDMDDDDTAQAGETTPALAAESSSRYNDSKNAKINSVSPPPSSSSSSSQSSMSLQRSNVEAQLDTLELHVEDLTKMQEQTILTLEILTRELQAQRAARQGAAAAASATVAGA